MKNLKIWVTIISAINKDIRHMNAGPKPCIHQDSEDTARTVRSMDIEPLNADQIPCGHQTNQQRQKVMNITTIVTTKLGRVVTTVKSMDTFLRIEKEYTSMVTTIDG